jgi:hypothetical protein
MLEEMKIQFSLRRPRVRAALGTPGYRVESPPGFNVCMTGSGFTGLPPASVSQACPRGFGRASMLAGHYEH